MRRRDFIAFVVSAGVALPTKGLAQEPQKIRRVSVLLGLAENDPEATIRIRAFRLGLRDLGWVDGRNIQVEYRYAGSSLEAINSHVRSLVASAPEVIVANSTPVLAALQRATSAIPIVFVVV